ncbi:protein RRP5 homolog isoform X3 [Engystomops pustulosus]|uniref:protein RRP5 homolog isoform X3 n=1 Tax=Engystomops pustulosus TaxID=76066 RepID=UPI003AFAA3F4
MEMEESFPRGGLQKKSGATAVKKRPREDDNLFSTEHEDDVIKKKKKDSNEKPKTAQSEKSVLSKAAPIELLCFGNIHEGMLFLGCVKEAREFELVVSLPYGLIGFVQATCICEAYTELLKEQVEKDKLLDSLSPLSELYSPGMLVRCTVLSLGRLSTNRQSIQLSLNPKLVNSELSASTLQKGMFLCGCVSSIEDHGYLVDIGIAGTYAFLPNEKAKVYLDQTNKASLQVGQYLNCVIDHKEKGGQTVRLSITQSDVGNAIATEDQKWTMNYLLPGLVVKAQIQKIFSDHIALSFLSSCTGVVDFLHMESRKSDCYKTDQIVKACILWVDQPLKTVRLTLLKNFLKPGRPLKQLWSDWVGTIHDSCTVTSLHEKAGVVFNLDGETLGFSSLVPLRGLQSKKFKEGSVHKGRVMTFSQMDQILRLSFQKDLVEAGDFRIEDVQVGQILKGTVSRLMPAGVIVNFPGNIDGLVPKLHLADVTLNHPEKIYTLGKTVKCRVLSVDTSTQKMILTRKEMMINSTLPIITSYQDATPGMISHGFICSVKPYGCVIRFYNDVQGLVRKDQLSNEDVPSPEEVFFQGQVVKVRVLECNPNKETMLLSFKDLGEGETSESAVAGTGYYGKIFDVKILSKTNDGLNVLILPEKVSAFLPQPHLSDNISNCELLWHCLKEGDKLTEVTALKISDNCEVTTKLTRKPSFITFIKKQPPVEDFSKVKSGMLFPGSVKMITSHGVFVELPYGLIGLAPIMDAVEKRTVDADVQFQIGQTVVARVTTVDPKLKRCLLSLKLHECITENSIAESSTRLSHCLDEVQLSRSLLSRHEDKVDGTSLCSLAAKMRLTLVVEKMEANGLVHFCVGQIPGAQTITAAQRTNSEKSFVEGEKVEVVVLHVDLLKSHVHVSVDETIVSKTEFKVEEGSPYKAVTQHLTKEFAIVSVNGLLVAIPRSSHYNNALLDSHNWLGEEIWVQITRVSPDEHNLHLGVKVTTDEGNISKKSRRKQEKPKTNLIVKIPKGTVKLVSPTEVWVSLDDVGLIDASQTTQNVKVGDFPTSNLELKQSVTCRVIKTSKRKKKKSRAITEQNNKNSVLELTLFPRFLNSEVKLPEVKNHLPGETATCYFKVPMKKIVDEDSGAEVGVQEDEPRRKRRKRNRKKAEDKVVKVNGQENKPKDNKKKQNVSTKKMVEDSGAKVKGQEDEPSRKKKKRNKKRKDKNKDVEVKDQSKDIQKEQNVPTKKMVDEDSGAEVKVQKDEASRKRRKRNKKSKAENNDVEVNGQKTIPKDNNNKEQNFPETEKVDEDSGVEVNVQEDKPRLEKKKLNVSKKRKNEDRSAEVNGQENKPKDNKKKLSVAKKQKVGEDTGAEVNVQGDKPRVEKKKLNKTVTKKSPAPRLQVSTGFSWDVSLDDLKPTGGDLCSSDSEDDMEEQQEEQPKANKTKIDLKKTPTSKETIDPDHQPQSVPEFERLVLTSPNNSANWIKYMDFYLQISKLDQARAVAERALKSIYFREEKEKLNVWVAMLKLENVFGTEETLQKCFERAIQYNDPLKAFQHMVDIYIASHKFKEADLLYNTMVKRFRQEKSVWWQYATFLLKQGQTEATHKLLQRALNAVPEKEHIDLISKFAQLEFQMGDALRAKALFESTLSSFPKRTDIWSVYIDMMVKYGTPKEVKDIFERVIHLSLAPKRIKFFFKRYLEYEKKHGNESTIQGVKEKALKYVESKASMTTE